MNNTYLLLGTNMGNRQQNMLTASNYINKEIGTITLMSKLYQTAAWGKTDEADFLNQVLQISTSLSPQHLMDTILNIELKMGRARSYKNAPRIIDIDILFFNNDIVTLPDLTIPHAEIANRRFVLTPLAEVASTMIHPVIGKTMHELLLQCPDMLPVKLFEPGI